MNKSDFLQKLQPYLEHQEMDEILLFLKQYLGENNDALISLSGQYNKIKREHYSENTLSKEKYDNECNRIFIAIRKEILAELPDESVNGNINIPPYQAKKKLPKTENQANTPFVLQPKHYIFLAVISVMVGLLVNWASEDMKQPVLAQLTKIHPILVVYPPLTFTILAAIVTFIGMYLPTFWENRKNKSENLPFVEITNEEKAKWATEFLRQYKHRIAHKIKKHFEIEMELLPDYEGTDTQFAKTHFAQLTKEDKNKAYHALAPIFERYEKRVLLIGEPGAGKTVLLLKFAVEKLEEYIQSPENKHFPIILNLASWRSEMQHFEVWLEKVLTQSGFSAATAKALVKEQPFLLLLDGLDEIRSKEDRESCLKALSDYLTHTNRAAQTIICSRKAEYKATEANAPVSVSFCVKPLTEKQLKEEIANKKQDGVNLLAALKGNKPLLETLQTPFYLATALEIFAAPHENVPIFTTKEEYQAYILPQYVNKQLNFPEMKYEKEKAEKYLRFLAVNMRKRGLLRIEMADLQPDWLGRRWIMGASYWLIIIPLTILLRGIYDLFFDWGWGSTQLIRTVLSSLLIGILVTYSKWRLFNPIDKRTWSIKTFFNTRNTYKTILVHGLIYWGLSRAIFFGLFEFITSPLPLRYTQTSLIFFIISSLCSGLIWVALYEFVHRVTQPVRYLQINNSYQRFISDFSWQLPLWFFLILISDITSIFVDIILYSWILESTLSFYWFRLILSPLYHSIVYSILLSAFSSHICLLLCFHIEGTLPWLPHKFLDAMAHKDIALLEKDGGTWRFRHELLQDYFCENP